MIDIAIIAQGSENEARLYTETAQEGLVAHQFRVVNYSSKLRRSKKGNDRIGWSRRSSEKRGGASAAGKKQALLPPPATFKRLADPLEQRMKHARVETLRSATQSSHYNRSSPRLSNQEALLFHRRGDDPILAVLDQSVLLGPEALWSKTISPTSKSRKVLKREKRRGP